MSTDVRATVDAYFAGINEERYDDVGALFAPDGRLTAPGTPPRTGPAEVADYLRRALAPYPQHLDDPTRTVVAGSTVLVEIRFTGTPEGGEELSFDAVDVFDVDESGKITSLSSWYDSHAVRRALRASMSAGAAER